MMPSRFVLGAACCLALAAATPLVHAQDTSAPPNDGLDLRFANGIAAIVEEKVITVDDVRREIAPLIPQIRSDSHNEQEFNQKLEQAQDEIIQQLIDRVLIVKEFHKNEKAHVPDSYIDNEIEEQQINEFDGDRSKFLAYLRSRGLTMKDYRKEVEDDLVYTFMRQQQRKSQSTVSPVKIETFYNENKERFYQEDSVHLRMIQFLRHDGQTDEALHAQADEVLTKFKNGEKFSDLAREYSQDTRRAKGGDWDWVNRSSIRKEFADVLFSLKKSECSDPIVLSDGAYLLYVEDRKYAGIQPLSAVRAQIENILVTQAALEATQRWLERLRREGYVKHF
ncbi:MAG TPA: peptidylprolyl isomerase [Opitutaceae bacterium]|jgi:peptidyl-prolyl cis-trans isomerase SurA|nr:peptidylprolyl isomerase [Opitutaceae bacterium]